jgi:DNA-binding MarR family transcriptional regulator
MRVEEDMAMARIRDRRQANWFWMNKDILDVYGPQLGATGIAIYAFLARCANEEGHAIPSLRYIARVLALSRPTVIKYLGTLEELGLIEIKHRKDQAGDFASTEYILLTPPDPEDGGGGQTNEPRGQTDLPRGQTNEPRGQTDLPRGQTNEPRGQTDLPQVVNDVYYGGKTVLPFKDPVLKKTKEKENPPTAATAAVAPPPLTPEGLVELFNAETPETHPKVTKLTQARRQKAQKALRQFPDAGFWHTVCAEISQSAFLLGLKASRDHPGFRGDFDWLLTKGQDGTENCVKVFEGKYRDPPPGTTPEQGLWAWAKAMEAAEHATD